MDEELIEELEEFLEGLKRTDEMLRELFLTQPIVEQSEAL